MTETTLLAAERVELGSDIKYSVIWLHGLGADGHDFEPIVPELGIDEKIGVRFIFPHAPVRPVTINAGHEMRAWYDITSPQIGRADSEGKDDILNSVTEINKFIDAEIEAGIAAEHIFLAGFSQGGVIALHAGLRYEQKLAGIVALSTYMPFADETLALAESKKSMPIFAAHGDYDPVVPVIAWKSYTEKLDKAGFDKVESHHFPMEHSLVMEEVQLLGQWFNAHF